MDAKIDSLYDFIPVTDICKIIINDADNLVPELDDRTMLLDIIKTTGYNLNHTSDIPFDTKRSFIINESSKYKYDISDELCNYTIPKTLNYMKFETFNYNELDTNILYQLVATCKIKRHVREVQDTFDEDKVQQVNKYLEDNISCFSIETLKHVLVDHDFFMLTDDNQKKVLDAIYSKITTDNTNNNVWEKFIMEYFECVYFYPLHDILLFFCTG